MGPPFRFTAREGAGTGFSGKERDGETGLDDFGARYLSGGQGGCQSG